MYYEINISKNGTHYFATSKRSLSAESQTKELYLKFKKFFPEEEGYRISVAHYSLVGEHIDVSKFEKGETK